MNNKKTMTVLFLLLAAVLVGLDQLTKYMIVSSFRLYTGWSIIDNFLSISQ